MFLKVDPIYPDSPPMVTAGYEAELLHIHALCYASRHQTKGFIPEGVIDRLTQYCNSKELAQRLVGVNLWEETVGGWLITNWRQYLFPIQPKERSTLRRKWEAIAWRVRPVVLQRGNYQCAYCGSTERLEVDHIHPIALGGTNDLDNLQVLCRSCNVTKGAN